MGLNVSRPLTAPEKQAKAQYRRKDNEVNLERNTERADGFLANKVEDAFWNDSMIRRTDIQGIDVKVTNGIVCLSGYVIGATNKQRAELAAGSVAGVKGVKNQLVTDDEIARDLAIALGRDTHTRGVILYTGVRNGVITLNGEAPSRQERFLTEESAAGIPGVRGVINYIRVPDNPVPVVESRFLQPAIGIELYCTDGASATIQKVIIDPSNRRVIAMIVNGYFTNAGKDHRSQMISEMNAAKRLLVIPITGLRYLTKESGFLHFDCSATAEYPEYDPAQFTEPDPNWTPPYPYLIKHVLFPIGKPSESHR